MVANTAYIFQPHFKTDMFRVACKDQVSSDKNYIVVTCSPTYNGVWEWDASYKSKVDIWANGALQCYCVPIQYCKRIKSLEELTNVAVIAEVQKMQSKWKKKEI